MIVRLLLALVLGLAVAVAVGCGSDDSSLIPGADAAGLQDELQAVQSALDDGNCRAASAAANDFERAARGLPTAIDAELRREIRAGAAKLVAEVPADCESNSVPTDTQTTETTETQTTTTTTTPTTTTPTTTTPVPTIPETIPETLPDGTGGDTDPGAPGDNGTGGATP